MNDICPVCGNDPGFEPWSLGDASFEICPFCKIQFGYDDEAGGDKEKRKKIYQNWNEAWIKNGKKPLSDEQELEVIKISMA